MIDEEIQNLISEYVETSVTSITLSNNLKNSTSRRPSSKKLLIARDKFQIISEKLFMKLHTISEEERQELLVLLECQIESILAEFRKEAYLKEKLVVILANLTPNSDEYIKAKESFKKVEKSLQEKATIATSYQKIFYYLKGLSVSGPKKV